MKKVEDIFQARGASISQVFKAAGGAVGFRIPTYQRKYSWDEKHIDRLFDDINEGMKSLKNDSESLTFIGTLILNEEKISGFDGLPLSVVDGQQRITTIIITSVVLHSLLSQQASLFESNENPVISSFISDFVKKIKNSLMVCFSGRYDPVSNKLEDFYPRLIREECDIWSTKQGQSEYASPVPKYLFEYLKFVLKGGANSFIYTTNSQLPGMQLFLRNLNTITNNIGSTKYTGSSDSLFENLSDLLLNSKYRNALFEDFGFAEAEISDALKKLGHQRAEFLNLIYLASFSSYFLSRLAVTKVIASDEKYAFEIFEALNTTGEPLTALETFKPIVSHYEDQELSHQGGFSRSDSKLFFDDLDRFMDLFNDSKKKQDESAALVVSFALLLEGKKESLHLNSQRRYLRDSYERLTSIDHRKEYISTLSVLLDFKLRFWQTNELPKQLMSESGRDEILCCLDFIKDMKTTLTIPLLMRFYQNFIHTGDPKLFFSVVKSVTAFLALWRSYFGGTAQIDSVFREIMFKGSKYLTSTKSFKLGKSFECPLPTSEELKEVLNSYLMSSGINSKDKWIDGLLKQPLYSKSKVLCRFLLITASDNADVNSDNGELFKGRSGAHNKYLRVDEWRNPSFSTIEHVAPQKGNHDQWDSAIYSEAYVVDSIGNLSLLPEKENSTAGNKSWEVKKLYFKALSSSTDHDLDEAIDNASSAGFTFKNKTKTALRERDCLPAIKQIVHFEHWTSNVISGRGKNIGSLCWDKFSLWLK